MLSTSYLDITRRMRRRVHPQLIIVSMVLVFFANALVSRLFHAHGLAAIVSRGLVLAALCFVLDRLIIYPYYRNPFRHSFPRLFVSVPCLSMCATGHKLMAYLRTTSFGVSPHYSLQ